MFVDELVNDIIVGDEERLSGSIVVLDLEALTVGARDSADIPPNRFLGPEGLDPLA